MSSVIDDVSDDVNDLTVAIMRYFIGNRDISWQGKSVKWRYKDLRCDNPVDSFLVLRSLTTSFHKKSYSFITRNDVDKFQVVKVKGQVPPHELLRGMRPDQELELRHVRFSTDDIKAIELLKVKSLHLEACEIGGEFRYPSTLSSLTVIGLQGNGYFNQKLLAGMEKLQHLTLNHVNLCPVEGNAITLHRCYSLQTIKIANMMLSHLRMPKRGPRKFVDFEVFGNTTIEDRNFSCERNFHPWKCYEGKFFLEGKQSKWRDVEAAVGPHVDEATFRHYNHVMPSLKVLEKLCPWQILKLENLTLGTGDLDRIAVVKTHSLDIVSCKLLKDAVLRFPSNLKWLSLWKLDGSYFDSESLSDMESLECLHLHSVTLRPMSEGREICLTRCINLKRLTLMYMEVDKLLMPKTNNQDVILKMDKTVIEGQSFNGRGTFHIENSNWQEVRVQ